MPQKPPPPPTPPAPREPGAVAPLVTLAELQAASEAVIYRTERHMRIFGAVLPVLAAAAIWTAHRAAGAVLMSLSIACQLISWAAMRAARRIQQRRLDAIAPPEGE